MKQLALTLSLVLAGPALAADVAPGPMAEAASPTLHIATDGHGEHQGDGHGAGHGGHGGHGDPTEHYNYTGGLPLEYKKFDVAGGPMGDGKEGDRVLEAGEFEEHQSAPFILLVLNFAVLVFLLWKYAWPRVNAMAMDRSDTIKTQLEEAAKLRAEAQAKLDEYSKKLSAADAEMQQMIAQVKADAEAEKARVLAAAQTQAAALKKDADTRIAAEIERARTLLAKEVASAAVMAAEKTLRDKATAADQTNLVEAFIGDLSKMPAKTPAQRPGGNV